MTRSIEQVIRERDGAQGARGRLRLAHNVAPMSERARAWCAMERLIGKALADGRRSATQQGVPKPRRARLDAMEAALRAAKETR